MNQPASSPSEPLSPEQLRSAMRQAVIAAALADTRPRADRGHRLIAATLALLAWTPLVLAAAMTPDPAGHGTHRQLGMPGCNFLLATGYPCPSCGMTTAFAAFVRGDLLGAMRAQMLGTLLAAGALLTALGATLTAVTGINLGPVVSRALYATRWWPAVAAGLVLASWGLKIWLMSGGS